VTWRADGPWRGGWCLGGVGEDDVDRWARAGAVAVVGRMGGGGDSVGVRK
jgi:hypothetical protein